MLLTQHWFLYLGEQIEGINSTPKTLGWHYKRRCNQQWKAFKNSRIKVKNPWENSFKIQKEEKRWKTSSEILKQPLENTPEFKGIQNSQVLALRAI